MFSNLDSIDDSVEESQESDRHSARETRGTTFSKQRILEQVLDIAQVVHGSQLDAEAPLVQAGMDSLATVELSQRLGNVFGVSLPATLVFDYPTVASIASFIGHKLGAAAVEEMADRFPNAMTESTLVNASLTPANRIAIVGSHLRLAGLPHVTSGTDDFNWEDLVPVETCRFA